MIFDVLVVGETPAAMMVAAMLVRKGLKVAWVVSPDHTSQAGERVINPKVPDIVWDLLPQHLIREILHRLGVPYKHLEKSEKKGSGIQIVCPEFRTVSIDGVKEFRSELKRVFGLNDPEAGRILQAQGTDVGDEFLKKYWGSLIREAVQNQTRRLSFLRAGEVVAPGTLGLEGVRMEPALKRLLELAVYSQSYLYQWVFPRSLVRHFIGNLSRLNIFAQGRLVFPDLIVQEVFRMGGGEVFPAEKEMFIELHREMGVSLWVSKDEVVNGTVCLMSVSPKDAPEIFERLHVSKRWLGKDEGDEDAFRIANITFSIDAMGIPGGMGENLIIYTGKSTDPFIPGDLSFLSLERAESGAYDGYFTVFYEGELGEDSLQGWAEQQLVRLEGLFPFMTSYITVKDLFVPGMHPLSSNRYYYGSTRKRRLGAVKLKKNPSGENFQFIGRQQLDYMGLEGEIITALDAFHWTMKRLSKL